MAVVIGSLTINPLGASIMLKLVNGLRVELDGVPVTISQVLENEMEVGSATFVIGDVVETAPLPSKPTLTSTLSDDLRMRTALPPLPVSDRRLYAAEAPPAIWRSLSPTLLGDEDSLPSA